MKGQLCELRCKPCEGGVLPISKERANPMLAQIPGWSLSEDGKMIFRDFTLKGFLSVMNFVNAIAFIANREGHHPDLCLGYNYCNVRLTTHAIDGLSENDFISAAKINALLE